MLYYVHADRCQFTCSLVYFEYWHFVRTSLVYGVTYCSTIDCHYFFFSFISSLHAHIHMEHSPVDSL